MRDGCASGAQDKFFRTGIEPSRSLAENASAGSSAVIAHHTAQKLDTARSRRTATRSIGHRASTIETTSTTGSALVTTGSRGDRHGSPFGANLSHIIPQ